MVDDEPDMEFDKNRKITVEAADIEGIVDALGLELVQEVGQDELEGYPEELREVLGSVADIYGGVQKATETDSRGRSRKMIRQYADRDDLSSEDVGHLLRVLETHGLVVQDGNRWRIPDQDSG